MTFFTTFQASFSPLKIRNFRIYLGGQAVSLIGTWLQVTAQGWVVWQISQSERALGVVGMLATLPILLLGPWAGVVADRLDRRKLLIITQTAAMLLAFTLAFLIQTDLVQLWHVYLIALCLGVATALDFPAQQAFLGDLSGMSEIRKAVNMNAMVVQVSRMLGPALSGLVVERLGAALAFWLNGLSFLTVIVSLFIVRATQVRKPTSGSAGRELGDSIRFVRGHARLQDLILFVVFVTFLALPVLNIMPAFASDVLRGGADTLGLVLAASGAGALVGTLFIAPMAQAHPRAGVIIGVSLVWMGLWFLAFSRTTWLPFSMLTMFLGSMGAPMIIATALGLIQLIAPIDMRARLLSLFTSVSFGMQPIASLAIGVSADSLGTPTAIALNGTVLVLVAVLMLTLRPGLRGWEVKEA